MIAIRPSSNKVVDFMAFIGGLFAFDELAEAPSGLFAQGFEFGIRAMPLREVRPVFLPQGADEGVPVFLTDLTVGVPFTTIKPRGAVLIAHFAFCVAGVPILSRQTAFAVQLFSRSATVHSLATFQL